MGKRGPPKQYPNATAAWFAEGTFCRILTVLKPDENRAAFIREAVEREIVRRSKPKGRERAKKNE
jgi:hypothetical protein